jgi:hypothetical protein
MTGYGWLQIVEQLSIGVLLSNCVIDVERLILSQSLRHTVQIFEGYNVCPTPG